jgi:hypothetical protein
MLLRPFKVININSWFPQTDYFWRIWFQKSNLSSYKYLMAFPYRRWVIYFIELKMELRWKLVLNPKIVLFTDSWPNFDFCVNGLSDIFKVKQAIGMRNVPFTINLLVCCPKNCFLKRNIDRCIRQQSGSKFGTVPSEWIHIKSILSTNFLPPAVTTDPWETWCTYPSPPMVAATS